MCGRYSLTTLDGFEPFFEINQHAELQPRYNIAPSQEVPVIVPGDGRRRLTLMRWGLLPFSTKSERTRKTWINARSESVDRRSAFKDSFARRRCLIPSDGFYEWIKGPSRRPVHFRLQDGGFFAYAGIWDRWREEEGELLLSCAILTVAPNQLVRRVHDRMPAILDRETFDKWLDASLSPAQVKRLLSPFPAEQMQAVEVSRYVNSPFNEGPECWNPPADGRNQERQRRLF